MSIFDNFFSPASSTSTTTTSNKYNSKQRALLDMLSNEASQGLVAGAQPYANRMWAGVNPYEQAFLNSSGVRSNYAGNIGQGSTQSTVPSGSATGGQAYAGGNPNFNERGDELVAPTSPGSGIAPQVQGPGYVVNTSDPQSVREAAVRQAISGNPAYTVDDQTTQAYWDQYIQPEVLKQQRALNEQYAPGIFSGGRDIAQGNFNTGVLGQYANLRYQDEQARRQALTEAANRQANTAQAAWNANVTNLQNTGALARSIEEKQLTTDYQRWMSGEADPVTGDVNQASNPYRALALQLLGISPYVYQQNIDQTGAGLGYGAANGLLNGLGGAVTSALPSLVGSAWDAISSGSDWLEDLLMPMPGQLG